MAAILNATLLPAAINHERWL